MLNLVQLEARQAEESKQEGGMPMGLQDLTCQDKDQRPLVHQRQLEKLTAINSDVHLRRRERPCRGAAFTEKLAKLRGVYLTLLAQLFPAKSISVAPTSLANSCKRRSQKFRKQEARTPGSLLVSSESSALPNTRREAPRRASSSTSGSGVSSFSSSDTNSHASHACAVRW